MTNPTVAETIAALESRSENMSVPQYVVLNDIKTYVGILEFPTAASAASHLERLQTENDRLREALNAIDELTSRTRAGGPSDVTDLREYAEIAEEAIAIAAAALAQEEGR